MHIATLFLVVILRVSLASAEVLQRHSLETAELQHSRPGESSRSVNTNQEQVWYSHHQEHPQNGTMRRSFADRDSCDDYDATPYHARPIITPPLSAFDPELAFIYRYRQQKSVNLGSWYAYPKTESVEPHVVRQVRRGGMDGAFDLQVCTKP